jgi:hypothetical protein
MVASSISFSMSTASVLATFDAVVPCVMARRVLHALAPCNIRLSFHHGLLLPRKCPLEDSDLGGMSSASRLLSTYRVASTLAIPVWDKP